MLNFTYLECDEREDWEGPILGLDTLLALDAKSPDGQVLGYICCIIGAISFGTNFVPFKFVRTEDGMFTQWVMCSTVVILGLFIQLIQGQPIFFSLNLIGGVLWCIGNCCVAPIINLIGLSIGMLLWNVSNVLMGWATGRFGLFVCPQIPTSEAMNYIGVALCVAAGGVYVFVKTETIIRLPECCKRFDQHDDIQMEEIDQPGDDLHFNQNVVKSEPKVFLGNLPPTWRRISGSALALGSGLCYGVQFLPSGYIQDHVIVDGARASQNGLDYVFTQFNGIYLASTVFFVVYVAIYRKESFVDVRVVLPSVLSGFLWTIGTCCFFLANSTLSQSITFPIISAIPGMVGSLWGIFLFGEISGLRNFLILGVAYSMTITGTVLTALSR